MFLQSSPLSSSVVRMEFGREVFHDGLEPLDASRLAQGEKVCCATPAFHKFGLMRGSRLLKLKRNVALTIFGAQHPLYMWSLLHACWLHNRFCVQHGLTPFERATGCLYEGKVCCYGEAVLGYLRTTAKAGPKWQKGIWLGKTTQNDVNILATDKGIFLTRCVESQKNGI